MVLEKMSDMLSDVLRGVRANQANQGHNAYASMLFIAKVYEEGQRLDQL